MPSSNFGDLSGLTNIEITDLESVQIPGSVSRPEAHNIVTVEVPLSRSIDSFAPSRIKDTKGIKYSEVARGFPDEAAQKNSRFRISDLARTPLSVEAEEEARIESEVQRRLEDRFNQLREQVSKEAYAEGFASGKGDARTQVQTEAKPMLNAFEELIRNFEHMSLEIFKANEAFMMKLLFHLVRSVVLKELKDDRTYTQRLVTHLLERIGTRENIKIFVGQAAFSSAESLKEGLAQSLGQLKNISVELDPNVIDSGCRVETDFGEIDGRILVQLENIAQTMGATATEGR
jgi:flagellar assembly protein FliH